MFLQRVVCLTGFGCSGGGGFTPWSLPGLLRRRACGFSSVCLRQKAAAAFKHLSVLVNMVNMEAHY